jgi:hypothetical protein
VIGLALALRFACELVAVAAVAWWGWPWLALPAAAVVIVLWGTFIGPRAPRRLADPARLVLELAVFAAATAALVAVGHVVLAVVFALVAVATAFPARSANA